jgi:hypothetical protein
LKLTRIEVAAGAPSSVAVFFAVEHGHGEPLPSLTARDFRIVEDGKQLAPEATQQMLLRPELAAAHYTLLLIDLSASATANEQLQTITRAAREFCARLAPYQQVAVYAFDGGRSIYEIVPFAPDAAAANGGLERLSRAGQRDPSTNLNGALLQALTELDHGLQQAKAPLHFGTLVVLTDGTDRAGRVPYQQMIDAVEGSAFSVYTLGVGHETDDSTLSRIGKSGYIRVEDSTAAGAAFSEIAERMVRLSRRYYLLSYCSPARGGQHAARVEAAAGRARGQLAYHFDAAGFSAECDPKRPAAFEVPGGMRRLREKLGP